jgi:hypothetical protein
VHSKFAVVSTWKNMVEQDHRRVKNHVQGRVHFITSGFVVFFVVFGLLKIGSVEARNPVPDELQYLEEPDRGEWQMPERVIETLGLRKSDVVADVGVT